jgi:hypothetical protein
VQELLNHPAVQGGLAPFVAALAVAFALFSFRLAGLAVVAALGTAVYLISGFAFPPGSAQQKILLISLVVPVLGVILDLAFKPTRAAVPMVGLVFGLLAIWVAWNILKQKEMAPALATGAGIAALVAWLTGAIFALRDDPVRAGAATLTLGVGVGVSAFLSGSGSYAQYGISVAAGAGAFLLVQILLGKTIQAGATFALSAGAASALIVAGAVLGSPLPWYAAVALALTPVATLLPLPRTRVWLQAIVATVYGGIVGLAACSLSWPELQQWLGL